MFSSVPREELTVSLMLLIGSCMTADLLLLPSCSWLQGSSTVYQLFFKSNSSLVSHTDSGCQNASHCHCRCPF